MRMRVRKPHHIVLPLAALGLLASHTNAQTDIPGLTDLSSLNNGVPRRTTTPTATSTTTRPTPTNTTPTTNPSATATPESTTNPPTTTTPNPSTPTPQQPTPPTTTTPLSNLPSTTSSILQILTGTLPTIIGATIPTPIIPDTSLAPFMQKSSLPEGTVFIAVGAILGFLGMSILAWRGLVAWSLHRSVKRSAGLSSHPYSLPPKRPGGGASKQGFYTGAGAGAGSSMSLDPLGPASSKLDTHPALRNSLFFSPTAGAGMHSPPGQAAASTRNSSASHLYLPAGYYTGGSSAPAGGHGTIYIGGGNHTHHHSIPTPSILSPLSTLSNLGPQVAGYTRARTAAGPATPPDSPGLYGHAAQYGYSGRSAKQSYLDSPDRGRGAGAGAGTGAGVAGPRQAGLYPESRSVPGSASGSRTPRAYLEDLFEHHGNGINR